VAAVQRLSDTGLIASVEGGFDINERLRSANETAKRPVAGSLSNSATASVSVSKTRHSAVADRSCSLLCNSPSCSIQTPAESLLCQITYFLTQNSTEAAVDLQPIAVHRHMSSIKLVH